MKSGSHVAAIVYTVRDFLKTPNDIRATFAKVRSIGYENVEIYDLGSIAATQIKSLLDDAGLRAIGYHEGIASFRQDTGKVIRTLQTLECDHVTIAWLPIEERRDGEAWKRVAEEMSGFGRVLAKEGIVLQYHNHDFEFQKFGGKTGLEILYAESDPKYLKAQLDTCWIARGGADPAFWCRKMKKRLDQVHCKDTVMLEGQGAIFAEVGEGNLNWPEILKACKTSGVKDYIVEQDSCPITQDPFKSIAISLNNLKKAGVR